jgi:hypothetical protein
MQHKFAFLFAVSAVALSNGMALAQPRDLPICAHHGNKTDCHIHDRATYLGMTSAKPDPARQPHAWLEYREQERLASQGHGR